MSAVLITGGAGFIGINLAYRLLTSGNKVYILDNLSRPDAARNLAWLLRVHGDRLVIEVDDVRNRLALRRVLGNVDHVFHLAAQVEVPSSVEDPIWDFEVNVVGTLNLLEEMRYARSPQSLIYASTNKVYGALAHVPVAIEGKRYVRADGLSPAIDESAELSFHSPYGCSKGAAEQYVLDFHRTYGLRTAVLRMSCIYGPHQSGTEDQGWIALFTFRGMSGRPITIYGDGRQVRDVLFIDDLVDALLLAQQRIDNLSGEAFNIGGGLYNTLSLLELLDVLDHFSLRPAVRYSPWRIGDQKYYVSDTRKFQGMTGWTPRFGINEGISALHRWFVKEQEFSPEPVLRDAS